MATSGMMYNSSKEEIMNYKEMKKEELVAKLEEQRHLAQAVEAKDVELGIAEKRFQEMKNSFAKELDVQKAKVKELQDEIRAFPDVENLKESIKTLEEQNKKIVAFGNQHINIFKNTLKALQGTLDNAIELEDIVVNSVKEQK
jgi:FMN phosphatase YigB (HAD superfamily)